MRTIAHKRPVRTWVGELATAAGADEPDLLARGLTILLDGGLAAGVLDGATGSMCAAGYGRGGTRTALAGSLDRSPAATEATGGIEATCDSSPKRAI